MHTVLLVDDDEVILSTFGLALRKFGYRVFEASTGIAAFEIAQQQLPDMIISDIVMSGGDGEALLQRIRQHPDLGNKQVVLMTGQIDEQTPRRGMEAGADDFLVKPVSLTALLKCVEARLKRAQVSWRVEDRMLAQLRSSLQCNLPHEFFTPLGGILGLSEILRSDFASLPDSETKEIVGDIHRSALRLHRTLRNYVGALELSVECDSPQLPPPLSMQEVEDSIWGGVKAALRRHGRKTDMTVAVDPCAILISSADLSLIVEELVDNACAYSRQDTPLEVRFAKEGILTVADQGRGMSESELEEIRAFHGRDRKKKHEQKGLGLGLVLVHKLASRCGAKPVLESRPSGGTEVRIAFIKPGPATRLGDKSRT